MGRAFVYVILGGGVAAGYAALEFSKRGISHGELCIISEEPVVPYERPALSKGFLLPEGIFISNWNMKNALKSARGISRNEKGDVKLPSGLIAPARLPSFHTCVGANEERLTPRWYRDNGIELVLGTRVKSVDVRRQTLLTATGETISYKILIIATGARALKLEEFGVSGSDAKNVCYLRDLADATRLVDVMQSCVGGNAVVIGGGYIGMECAASLVINKINVTMVFPEAHCIHGYWVGGIPKAEGIQGFDYSPQSTVHSPRLWTGIYSVMSRERNASGTVARLFTPKIATFYEDYYNSKGVKFIKGTVLSSFENDSNGKVTTVILRDGTRLPTDMVVVGIGIRPNTSLFEGQLTLEKGGIKVNGHMQTSNSSVYAVGDVASFPVKLFGETRRLEHVDSSRKTARHAVTAIMAPDKTGDFDYLPFFYSRVFTLSWQFYGDNVGEAILYGDFSGGTFGAYWVSKGQLVGSFLEGGTKEEYEAIAKVTKLRPVVENTGELERQGLGFALSLSQQPAPSTPVEISNFDLVLERPSYSWHAAAGVVVAASVAMFAYWYGTRRRRW
ncbi:hypothetical protein HHK36_024951 [Tetracentron sinense]|uniref:monodehydroascorbate reductase (NADH) n=1 Tax=Tetracentron sinense TaxID=13715 RepID=A0A834YLT4_TETSI|nr:hypothetical protein HHK36_024951 [Tetracentron sinense]